MHDVARELAWNAAIERAAQIAAQSPAYDDALQRSAGCATVGERIAAMIRGLAQPLTPKDQKHDR